MRPRRFKGANGVFSLPGGNEDNDLWVQRAKSADGAPIIQSVWEPTDAERELIANGGNVVLCVWGQGTPPVALLTAPPDDGEYGLGKRPDTQGAEDE